MLHKRIATVCLLAAFALVAPRSSHAQETGVAGELERVARTTPQEKLQYSVQWLEEMRTGIKAVQKLVEVARREGNVERLQCLTNRLTAMRALLQVSEAAGVSMQDALGAGEVERGDHEFRKLAVAATRSRQLLAEAERCADETAVESGETTVRVFGVEGDDTGTAPFDDLDIGFDPPEASPFM